MLFSEASVANSAEGVAEGGAEVLPDVPLAVEALDGIESNDEAHNSERPARKSLKKKPARGKPLSEFKVGDSVKAKVKTITTYGAFLDIGATTDGLLHISQLAVGFVSDVNEILKEGEELDVRITKIDEGKNQVALTLLTLDQETQAKEASQRSRQPRAERPGQQRPANRRSNEDNRRDDSAILAQLVEKGWSSEKFVEGRVVSTVDFGAFVRIEASQLNADVSGEFDGLVHISALTAGRANSVASYVSVDDKVQVRVKGIADRKVSLTMVSPEDEAAQVASGNASVSREGAKDWKESLAKMQGTMPTFKNRPMVVDTRK